MRMSGMDMDAGKRWGTVQSALRTCCAKRGNTVQKRREKFFRGLLLLLLLASISLSQGIPARAAKPSYYNGPWWNDGRTVYLLSANKIESFSVGVKTALIHGEMSKNRIKGMSIQKTAVYPNAKKTFQLSPRVIYVILSTDAGKYDKLSRTKFLTIAAEAILSGNETPRIGLIMRAGIVVEMYLQY